MNSQFPFQVQSHSVPVLPIREYPHAVIDESDRLQVSVKNYIPLNQSSTPYTETQPLTIIAAGALGFIKELYEPLFVELLNRAQVCGVRIRSIWIADMYNIGESARANRMNLGCDPRLD